MVVLKAKVGDTEIIVHSNVCMIPVQQYPSSPSGSNRFGRLIAMFVQKRKRGKAMGRIAACQMFDSNI